MKNTLQAFPVSSAADFTFFFPDSLQPHKIFTFPFTAFPSFPLYHLSSDVPQSPFFRIANPQV